MHSHQEHWDKDNKCRLPIDHLWPPSWDNSYPRDYQFLHPVYYRSENEDEDFRSVRRLSWDDYIKADVGDEI